MDKHGVERGIEGEKRGNKPVWHLRLHLKPDSKAAKALAANGIQMYLLDVDVLFYPEDIAKLKDVIDVEGDSVKLISVDTIVKYKVHYDDNYNEAENGILYEIFKDGTFYTVTDIKNMIQTEVNAWIAKNGKTPDPDTIKGIVVSLLSNIQEEADTKEQRLHKIKEYAKKWFEEKRREHEEHKKIEEAQLAEKQAKKAAKKQKLLNKPWIKAIVDANNIEEVKSEEIQRFKQKFSLEDDEISMWCTSNKPYVHIEAWIDLRILGISRTLIIRNYRDSDFDFKTNTDTYSDYFSDLEWFIANKTAEIFNGDVQVATDDDYNPSEVHLVVVSGNDIIEVAS